MPQELKRQKTPQPSKWKRFVAWGLTITTSGLFFILYPLLAVQASISAVIKVVLEWMLKSPVAPAPERPAEKPQPTHEQQAISQPAQRLPVQTKEVENVALFPRKGNRAIKLNGIPAHGHNSRGASSDENCIPLSPGGIFVGAPAAYWKKDATIHVNIDGLLFMLTIKRNADGGLYLRLPWTKAKLEQRLGVRKRCRRVSKAPKSEPGFGTDATPN